MFIWIDLESYLPLDEASGDGWAAERILSERFKRAGVMMDTGESYHAQYPGRFRLMFCVEESTLKEGIKRSAFFPLSNCVSKIFDADGTIIEFQPPCHHE